MCLRARRLTTDGINDASCTLFILALLVEATSSRRWEMVGECYPSTIRRRITPPGPKSRTHVTYISIDVLLP